MPKLHPNPFLFKVSGVLLGTIVRFISREGQRVPEVGGGEGGSGIFMRHFVDNEMECFFGEGRLAKGLGHALGGAQLTLEYDVSQENDLPLLVCVVGDGDSGDGELVGCEIVPPGRLGDLDQLLEVVDIVVYKVDLDRECIGPALAIHDPKECL